MIDDEPRSQGSTTDLIVMQELALKHQQGIANKQLFLQTLLVQLLEIIASSHIIPFQNERQTLLHEMGDLASTVHQGESQEDAGMFTSHLHRKWCHIVIVTGWGKNSIRLNVVNEIVTTEREYLNDLKMCVRGYLEGPTTLKGSSINVEAVSASIAISRSCR